MQKRVYSHTVQRVGGVRPARAVISFMSVAYNVISPSIYRLQELHFLKRAGAAI